jgi:predicted RNase H-like HicB family nuclease
MSHVVYKVEMELEDDGRWIAEVLDLPGVMAYGTTENEAVASARALALRVLADRIGAQKEPAETVTVSIEAA